METIKDLKKNDKFKFNGIIYTVKQKFSNWRKNDDPYLLTDSGDTFYNDELEIEKIKTR